MSAGRRAEGQNTADLLAAIEQLGGEIPSDRHLLYQLPYSVSIELLGVASTLLGRAAAAIRARPCTWTLDDNDGFYNTACGGAFWFDNGTPAENKAKFCPYCGGALVVADPNAGFQPEGEDR